MNNDKVELTLSLEDEILLPLKKIAKKKKITVEVLIEKIIEEECKKNE